MPESHKAERRRVQKANRAAGIGDEQGRIPSRVKEPPKMFPCSTCQQEMKVTKTNTELKMHAESKHGKTLEDCFPGATEMAAELVAAGAVKGGKGAGGPTTTKADKKKKNEANMDDMLSAGLSTGKKKGKK